MSLLLIWPDPGSDTRGADWLLDHLRAGWPGTLLLVAGRELPVDLRPDPVLDWVGLPGPAAWDRADELAADWLAILGRRFEVQAALGLGPGSAGLLGALRDPVARLLLLGPAEREPRGFEGIVLGPAAPGELFERLDRELTRVLPIELAPDPDSDPRAALDSLRHHAAWSAATRIVLRWRGQASAGLLDWLRMLATETTVPIELRLLTSELFDLPRAGLTHAPGEFLLQPAAWTQAVALARLVALAPARVTIRLHTHSRADWIQAGVRAADQAVDLVRRALRTVAGGGS